MSDRRTIFTLTLAAQIVLHAGLASAQCPDGTPPPCRAATIAAARRTSPAMDPRGWIVVPFGNATKTADLDWLRDASVNLLSMDLGQWADLDVVPDKHVGDLLRDLPSKNTQSLTLNEGLALARRAGAANLVMGDFFRAGKGARIIANVFDARSGNKIRTVTQQTPDADSLLSAFSPLARGVLAVPPPADAKIGDVGTHRLDAYQAYLLGVKALHRFDLDEAKRQLTIALTIDSTFALAHHQLALAIAWSDDGNYAAARAHSASAQRLGAALPKRERTLIDALAALNQPDYARACALTAPLVQHDSTDVEALFLLGECSYHDGTVIPSKADTLTGTFQSSWNVAMRAFERILDIDPSYYLAFKHVLDIYSVTQRPGTACTTAQSCTAWFSVLLRDGDSLVTAPVIKDDVRAFSTQLYRAGRERPAVENLRRLDEVATRWRNADTGSARARFAVARVKLRRGDVAAADQELRQVSRAATAANLETLRTLMEIAIKLGRGDEARALFDSAVKASSDGDVVSALQRGVVDLTFGRFARFDRAMTAFTARMPAEAAPYGHAAGRALVGIPPADLAHLESAYFNTMNDPACVEICRYRRILGTLSFASRIPRPELQRIPAAYTVQIAPALALQKRDRAALKVAASDIDSIARASVAMASPEFSYSVIAADTYLELGDSASALKVARFFVDTAMMAMQLNAITVPIGFAAPMPPPVLWPRMMLLRADLALAAGQRDEARTWYRRVLDLWSHADPELQPVVTRIRTALASLGPP